MFRKLAPDIRHLPARPCGAGTFGAGCRASRRCRHLFRLYGEPPGNHFRIKGSNEYLSQSWVGWLVTGIGGKMVVGFAAAIVFACGGRLVALGSGRRYRGPTRVAADGKARDAHNWPLRHRRARLIDCAGGMLPCHLGDPERPELSARAWWHIKRTTRVARWCADHCGVRACLHRLERPRFRRCCLSALRAVTGGGITRVDKPIIALGWVYDRARYIFAVAVCSSEGLLTDPQRLFAPSARTTGAIPIERHLSSLGPCHL